MKLIITNAISKTELEPLKNIFNLEIIKSAARKSLLGLGISIKSSIKIPATSLSKVYLTGRGGAGRVIFLLITEKLECILVMIRAIKDKQIGVNMTVDNPKFKETLDRNLGWIIEDLKRGDYSEQVID